MEQMNDTVERFLKKYTDEIMDAAESLRKEPLPYLSEEMFSMYEKIGNRLLYEKLYFQRRKFLLVYGLAAIISHRDVDRKILGQVICCICGEECWALPAHVKKNHTQWRRTVDLFAAETAQALMEIVSVLKEELPAYIYRLVCDHVEYRVLQPFFESKIPYAFWENGDNNWNAVCCGAIGSASIYLYGGGMGRPIDACLKRICSSLEHYIDSFPEDGACIEGLSYFTYGMSYFVGFAQQLNQFTAGEADLLSDPRVEQIALFQQKCYFKGGLALCFSDGDSRERYRMGLTSYLAGYYEDVFIPPVSMAAHWDTDFNFRWMSAYRDYLWTADYLDAGAAKVKDIGDAVFDFRSAQWSILHSAQGIGVGMKGGSNAQPHNHNDVGSFFYLCGDEMFLDDLGAGEYTRDYFGAGRYELIGNSSLGHNVPIVNGKLQCAGPEYRCTKFETDGKGRTEVHFGAAYGAGEEISRVFAFDFGTGALCITDYFRKNDTVIENLVTHYKPEIDGSKIVLSGEKSDCVVRVQEEAEIKVREETFVNHKGVAERIYLIQWEGLENDGLSARGVFSKSIFTIAAQPFLSLWDRY